MVFHSLGTLVCKVQFIHDDCPHALLIIPRRGDHLDELFSQIWQEVIYIYFLSGAKQRSIKWTSGQSVSTRFLSGAKHDIA